jgi:uncharacterized protein (DUF305 family)
MNWRQAMDDEPMNLVYKLIRAQECDIGMMCQMYHHIGENGVEYGMVG